MQHTVKVYESLQGKKRLPWSRRRRWSGAIAGGLV